MSSSTIEKIKFYLSILVKIIALLPLVMAFIVQIEQKWNENDNQNKIS